MKITVLYNLPGTSTTSNIAEADDDTGDSVNGVATVLKTLGHEVDMLGIDQKAIQRLSDLKTDLVFNLIEWSGRETDDAVRAIQILEDNKIKFTGCGSVGYRLSSDKVLMKKVLVENNISTPKYSIFNNQDSIKDYGLSFPVIVKPAMEHCAIGISQESVVFNYQDSTTKIQELIDRFQQPVIVEEFIDGPEAHVTVIEKDGKPWVLPPAVFEYKKKDGYVGIMSYEAKWNQESWESQMTEWTDDVSPKVQESITKIAQETFVKLGGKSHSRIDMRIRGDDVYVLEINNNPGIGWDDDSGLTYSCKKTNLEYMEFVNLIVKSAL